MLMQAAAVLSLVWMLFQHVGLWQVNIMRCNNKASVSPWQRPSLTPVPVLLVQSPLNCFFIPASDIYCVCVRIITTHSHTPLPRTKPIRLLCVFLISLFILSNISLISCLIQHTHTHIHYITSFLTISMPPSWINGGIASSHRSQVYSTGGVESMTGPVCPVGASTYRRNEQEAKVSVCSLPPSQSNWAWSDCVTSDCRWTADANANLPIWGFFTLDCKSILSLSSYFISTDYFSDFPSFCSSETSHWGNIHCGDWSLKGHKHAAHSLTVNVKRLYCKYFITLFFWITCVMEINTLKGELWKVWCVCHTAKSTLDDAESYWVRQD